MKIDGHAFVSALDDWLDARVEYEASKDEDREMRSFKWERYRQASDALAATLSPEESGE